MNVLPSGPVTPFDLSLVSRALDVAGRLANDAAEVIIATAGRACRPGSPPGHPAPESSPFDWVTDTGHTLERHTRRILAAEFPGVPMLGRDCDEDASHVDHRWIVAPVDGTANYLAGLPWCAYSLALVDSEGPVVGVVADPHRAQIYAAARRRGVRANGVAVRVSAQTDLSGGLICTELTTTGPWPGMTAFTERASRAGSGVRVLGCAALAVAQVALGHAVAAVLHGYHECDIAAAVALALESGAVVLDRHGRRGGLPREGLLVAAPGVAAVLHSWWADALAGV